MIVLLLALMSLCAISFTYLLYKKNLRLGAVAVTFLYANIVLWTYMVFIIDVANFGFRESRSSDLLGSTIFRSFTELRDSMSVMPEGLHVATATVAILVAAIVILEFVISSIRIVHAISELYRKDSFHRKEKIIKKEKLFKRELPIFRIYLLHCRLNN